MRKYIFLILICIIFISCDSTSDTSGDGNDMPQDDNHGQIDEPQQSPRLLIGAEDIAPLAAKLGDKHLSGSIFDRQWANVSDLDFSTIVADGAALIADLDAAGYVDEEGEIAEAFILLGGASEINLPTGYSDQQKTQIYNTMLDALYQRDNKVHSALECLLRGVRAHTAINYLMAYVAHVEETGNFSDGENDFPFEPDHCYIADLQWNYMTQEERSRSRAVLLAASEDIYDQSVAESRPWYLLDEHINNWYTSHMTGYACHRMLYPALLFPDDTGSTASRERAITLLRAWWDRMPAHEDAGGTAVEMIDETLTAPTGYGLWDMNAFVYLALALSRNGDFDPFDYAGEFLRSEGVYRTYILSFLEGTIYNSFSKASYIGAGHGDFNHIAPYDNIHLLQLAAVYNDPVLAWHYYANPSPCVRDDYSDWLSRWDEDVPPIGWKNIPHLLYWGKVAPVSPQDADWPLTAYYSGAGVSIIRKSWDKHDGLIWIRGGYGGSHYQPSQGTVIYHADDAVILGNGGAQSYSADSRTNNVLLVDGDGQISPYTNLPAQRQPYGSLTRIDDDTYQVDAGLAYADLSYGVDWTRRVHYNRAEDILEIHDNVTTNDGLSHELRFNWVTKATVQDNHTYELPGGYTMTAVSESTLQAQAATVTLSSSFETLQVSAQGTSLTISWYIQK